jgi:hypothetical protein
MKDAEVILNKGNEFGSHSIEVPSSSTVSGSENASTEQNHSLFHRKHRPNVVKESVNIL